MQLDIAQQQLIDTAVPYGTAIAVATFIVLQRPTVIALFERPEGA